MIKQITIKQYRKLKDITLTFSKGVNFISGVNGTCKSSLLHMISNSFQGVVASKARLIDNNCLRVIKGINAGVNLKIEALTKDAKKYKDPAAAIQGTLFSVLYFNEKTLSFRKHNSRRAGRFAIKPHYSKGSKDRLPEMPVIYLGLSRLYPIGEFQNDKAIVNIRYKLPDSYRNELKQLYDGLTHIQIETLQPQKMKGVKNRNDFTTQHNGVDGNTISSGEDNVFIILTALLSLKYYYENLQESQNEVESILLIDEFDATLHPSLQESLLCLIKDFSTKYKIQVVSTTHSLSLLKYAFEKKYNVLYLCDNIESVYDMQAPDIHKIEMKLKNISRESFYADKEIPVFMEDDEARMFMHYYMNYLSDNDSNFQKVKAQFHFVDATFGADTLRGLFDDEKFTKIIRAICILDGDKTDELPEYMIALPGKLSPERLVFEYAEHLYSDETNGFWTTIEAIHNNFDRPYYRDNIHSQYKQALEADPPRVALKSLWNKNKTFVALIIKTWLNDPNNSGEIKKFTGAFHLLFFKTADYHGLNQKDWPAKRKAEGDPHE